MIIFAVSLYNYLYVFLLICFCKHFLNLVRRSFYDLVLLIVIFLSFPIDVVYLLFITTKILGVYMWLKKTMYYVHG